MASKYMNGILKNVAEIEAKEKRVMDIIYLRSYDLTHEQHYDVYDKCIKYDYYIYYMDKLFKGDPYDNIDRCYIGEFASASRQGLMEIIDNYFPEASEDLKDLYPWRDGKFSISSLLSFIFCMNNKTWIGLIQRDNCDLSIIKNNRDLFDRILLGSLDEEHIDKMPLPWIVKNALDPVYTLAITNEVKKFDINSAMNEFFEKLERDRTYEE